MLILLVQCEHLLTVEAVERSRADYLGVGICHITKIDKRVNARTVYALVSDKSKR
jgi:hypothetical protein